MTTLPLAYYWRGILRWKHYTNKSSAALYFLQLMPKYRHRGDSACLQISHPLTRKTHRCSSSFRSAFSPWNRRVTRIVNNVFTSIWTQDAFTSEISFVLTVVRNCAPASCDMFISQTSASLFRWRRHTADTHISRYAEQLSYKIHKNAEGRTPSF